MIKFLFFDYRDVEIAQGFTRQFHAPRKRAGAPLLRADLPSEVNLMSFYGTVIRRPTDGLWQLWYKCYNPNDRGPALAYAHSTDGIAWERPVLDLVKFQGQGTNILFDGAPHGTAVIYDEHEPRPGWKYKLVHGAKPTQRVAGFRSADGIHWVPAGENPALGVTSGGPVGLMRAMDGRYVLYIRPIEMDRRVARSESWDFIHWTEPRVVIDQQPDDPPQVQYYGMQAAPYGAYELGILWMWLTKTDDLTFFKNRGLLFSELAYSRSGWSWRRAAAGTPFIPIGEAGAWDGGQIHPASLPVFLDNEIRFYYSAASVPHEISTRGDAEPKWGISYASIGPDRFISLNAGDGEAELLTRPFWTEAGEFYANAQIAAGGSLRAEVTDLEGKALEGFALADAAPVQGDSVRHRLSWRGKGKPADAANRQIRLRVRVKKAALYALSAGKESEGKDYWRFRIPHALPMEQEKNLLGM